MTIKQTLFSVLILGSFVNNALAAEPQVFIMNLNKDEFDSSMPIPQSKYSTTEALFALYQLDQRGIVRTDLMPIGCLEDISKLIKNSEAEPSFLPRPITAVLKQGQKENKSLDCVYYESCNAVIISTQRTDLAKKLERILSSEDYSKMKNHNITRNK